MPRVVRIIFVRGGVIQAMADNVSVNPNGVSVLSQDYKSEKWSVSFYPNEKILDLTISH